MLITDERIFMINVRVWDVVAHQSIALWLYTTCRYQCLVASEANKRETGAVSDKQQQVEMDADAEKAMVTRFLPSLHGIISKRGYHIGKTKVKCVHVKKDYNAWQSLVMVDHIIHMDICIYIYIYRGSRLVVI